MADPAEKPKPAKFANTQVHMANERTFLAWIRTSIGIMAFGFVVEKFALFIRKISYLFAPSHAPEPVPDAAGYSSIFGIILVALGALMGVLSFIHYKKVERGIEQETYQPSTLLDIMVAIGILAIGIFLVYYMIHSI